MLENTVFKDTDTTTSNDNDMMITTAKGEEKNKRNINCCQLLGGVHVL